MLLLNFDIFFFIGINLFASTSAQLKSMTPNIFCSGKILHYVQMSRIFKDSKYFVDMKLKFAPQKVEDDFEKFLNKSNNNPNKKELQEFVEENFDPPGAGFEPWIPDDWKKKPSFVNNIYDIHLRNWAKDLNAKWKNLGHLVSDDVLKNSSQYSQIYVPFPFIVPGGRFREFYYWDSYWIIEGLILSEMFSTARNMIKNYLYLVERYSYIPNGGRVYYLGRSQPPFLIPMFHLFWKSTNDHTFLKENLSTLEKEFKFWMKNRSVTVMKDQIKYKVFQFNVQSNRPRPESYYADTIRAEGLDQEEKIEFFSGIQSAAESGWDFSSRWFLQNETRINNLADIHTNHLAPICLNSILGYNAKLLSEFFLIVGNETKAEEYKIIAESINKTIDRIFWDDDKGFWFDFNIITNNLQPGFYSSGLVPLWAETYGTERDPNYIAERVINYLESINITSFPGGIPTSIMKNSTDQWDLPNGWAPLQYFAVLGLNKIGHKDQRASSLAFSLAEKWTLSCYKGYINSTPHSMYEKYDVTKIGVPGGGGEYLVQEGFGWTNGVAMKFLTLYGHKIRTSNAYDPAPVVIVLLLSFVSIISITSYVYRLRFNDNRKNIKLLNTSQKIDEHSV
ncbi:UNVERIFIED_CONTAM: hypothetical protein GTU68_009957 [Idotea baltica]|nr:hypothetical protein [Idotea baltica]